MSGPYVATAGDGYYEVQELEKRRKGKRGGQK
jgi:hypothetical protein